MYVIGAVAEKEGKAISTRTRDALAAKKARGTLANLNAEARTKGQAQRQTNAACATLFDRLVAKGKNKKLALIAVCNKLLKRAFAIVNFGVPYQADFNLKFILNA